LGGIEGRGRWKVFIDVVMWGFFDALICMEQFLVSCLESRVGNCCIPSPNPPAETGQVLPVRELLNPFSLGRMPIAIGKG